MMGAIRTMKMGELRGCMSRALALWTVLVGSMVAGCDGDRPPAPGEDGGTEDAQVDGQLPTEGREANRPPVFASTPPRSVREGDEYVYEISVSDPDDDRLVVTLEEAPEFVIYDAARRRIRWRPEQDQDGTQSFVVVAADGLAETRQEWVVDVEDVNLPPRFLSTPERCTTRGDGYSVVLEAYDPDDAVLTFAVAAGPPGMRVEGSLLTWIADAAGPHDVDVVVRDPEGAEGHLRYRLGVAGFGSSASPPVASLSPPASTAETIPIVGTASSGELLYYELGLSRLPSGERRVFYTGVSSVVDDELARFPASNLMNGRYAVDLEVRDVHCAAATARAEMEVTGGAKLGVTQYEHIDMEIQTGNLLMRVERVYDSKNLDEQDFGHGWHLTAFEMHPVQTAPPGSGWTARSEGGALSGYSLEGVDSRIEVPTGQDAVQPFVFFPRFESPIDPRFVTYEYADAYGGSAQLECVGCPTSLIFDESSGSLTDDSFAPFRPRQFVMRSPDGSRSELDLDRGLTRIVDRNGNGVTITSDAITHDAGVGFRFEREGRRITAAIGPNDRRVEYIYDERNDLRRVIFPDGTEERYAYVAHLLTRVADGMDNQILRNDHDEEGRLVHQITPAGDENFFDYETDTRTTIISDGAGNQQISHYGESGQLLDETDPLGSSTTYEYDDRGRVTRIVESSGSTIERQYDDQNRIVSESVDGQPSGFDYDEFGEVVGVDGEDYDIDATTDAQGNLDSLDMGGLELDYDSDDSGNLTDIARPDGSSSHADYDALGRPSRFIDPTGEETTVEYDEYGEATRVVDSMGTTELELDDAGREVARIDPAGNRSEYTYDALGRVASERTPEGERRFEYDRLGRVRRTFYPDGTSELVSYDSSGNVVARTTRAGGVTEYTYDAVGQPIEERRPDGSTWHFTYDSRGEVASTIDGAGHSFITERDVDGRIVREIDPTGYEVRKTYAAADHEEAGVFGREQGPLSIVDTLGRTTRFEYSMFGEQTAQVFPDGSRITTEYDENARPSADVDEEGRRTAFTLDANDEPLAVFQDNGRVTRFEWQGERPAAVIDGRGNRTTYEYLPGGMLTRERLPSGDTRTIEYEDARAALEIGFDGERTVHRYDALGRLVATESEGASLEREWQAGQQSAATLDGARHELGRNSAEQVVRATFPEGDEIRYAYDRAGRIARVATPYDVVQYTYDAAGHLASTVSSAGETRFVHDVAGRLSHITYANGASTRTEFNDRDWPTRIIHLDGSGQTVLALSYTYDRSGRVLEIDEGGGTTTSYAYDGAGELVAERRVGRDPYTREYTLDLAGNRTAVVADGIRTTYTYDENNRLLTATAPSGTTRYTWSNSGRLLEENGPDGRVRYAYHPVTGQLTLIEHNGEMTRIRYDGWHNLREIDRNGRVERFLVDPLRTEAQPRILAHEVDNEVTSFTATDFGIVGASGATTAFPLRDAIGTARAFVDASGAAVGSATRSAFGEVIARSGTGVAATGFQGLPSIDDSRGLVWMGLRTYDARAGRFTSRDLITARPGHPLSANAYSFASNDPLRYIDPTGTFEGLVGLIVNIGIRIGKAAWSAGVFLVTRAFFLARLGVSLLWRGLQFLLRLANPTRWNANFQAFLNRLNARLFSQTAQRGPCGGIALFACARYLGYGTRTYNLIVRLLSRVRPFQAGTGIRLTRLLQIFQRVFKMRTPQIAGSGTTAMTEATCASQAAGFGRGMYLYFTRYTAANGTHIGNHFVFAVGGRAPFAANWVNIPGATVTVISVHRLIPIRGCSTTGGSSDAGYVLVLVAIVVVVRRRKRER